MEKSYRDTKEFLIEKLIEDIASQKQIELKIKEHSLTQREYLFNTISLTCKMLYHKKKLPDYLIEELKS